MPKLRVHGKVGAYVVKGACVAKGDVHDEGGHTWQRGACMAGGVYMVGECMAGETATAADGTHPTGMHSRFFMIRRQTQMLLSIVICFRTWRLQIARLKHSIS